MADVTSHTTALREHVTGKRATLSGAALTIVAGFLPWARRRTPETTDIVIGIDVDGFLTLLLGLAVVGIVLAHGWSRKERVGCALLGVLILALVGQFLVGIAAIDGMNQSTLADVSLSPHVGPFLTALGAALLLGGAVGGPVLARLT